MKHVVAVVSFLIFVVAACGVSFGQSVDDVPGLFEPNERNRLVMKVEAAIAGGQAELGIVPASAAAEIAAKADPKYAPLDEVEAENLKVRHRMVALLNVWRRSLSEEASDALHLGVTTVDIYDTVLVLQVLGAIDLMLLEMRATEEALACLAVTYRDTPMMGRTLGQHALPITFGKKVSVWLAQTRRNVDRLYEVRARLRTSGVLKGAVGTYLGLGDQGLELERRVSRRLGLDTPEPADWRPARDVFAEYAQVLALISKSNATIGGEVFRLQMTDIGEVVERRTSTAVSSSSMPHKSNPSLSEALIYYGRTIPALAMVILDDVEAVFERDNTSRPNATLEEITIEAAEMLSDTRRLIGRLEVDTERMRRNLNETDGMIMSQRVVLEVADRVGKTKAEDRVREAAERSLEKGTRFRDELLADRELGPILRDRVDALLDPTTSLGLAAEQVDATLDWVDLRRDARGEPWLVRSCGK